MTQAEFNEGVLNALLSIIAELDLRSDVGDNSCTSLFAEVRQLGRAMGFADYLKRDDLGWEIEK